MQMKCWLTRQHGQINMLDKNNRRDFIRRGFVLSTTAICPLINLNLHKILFKDNNGIIPELVNVNNGEPEELFDNGIQALGGISRFVRKGQTVVIKPNTSWDRGPETGANTNPLLVKRIIEHCKNAGAKDIFIFDHTIDDEPDCYKHSGIAYAALNAGGRVVSGNNERYYQEVSIPKAKQLKKTKVHELIL